MKLRGADVTWTLGQPWERERSSAREEERRKSVPSAGEGDTLRRRNPRKGAAAGSLNRRAGKVRTPGELKALKARIGLGTTLAAYGGGARIRRVMADRIRGSKRHEGIGATDEVDAASWEGKPLKGGTPYAPAG